MSNPEAIAEAKKFVASSYAKYKQGDYEGAIADIDKVIGLTSPNAMLYYNRGVMRAKKGDLEEARADYEKAVKLAPDKKEKFAPLLKDITSKMADTTTQILEDEHRTENIEQRTENFEIPGYQIEVKLGEGGMGAVYKAKQLSLGREVAIKILASKFGEDPKFVARFEREAKIAGSLNHKNITSVLETGVTAQGYHYYVMEFVEGTSLAAILAKRKVLPEQEALKIIEQASEALEEANKHNIIHRDIKPDNIMLTKNGDVKLCDLGIAKQTQGELAKTLTMTGEAAFFTPAYVSPEQLTGEKLDIRTDIYSLGVTLYEMVTGHLPFTGNNASEMASSRLTKSPAPPRKRNPKISSNLNNLILRMMARDPKHRFTPSQLLTIISRLKQGGRVLAPPKTYTKWLWLAAGILVAIVVLFVLSNMSSSKGKEWELFETMAKSAEKSLADKRLAEAESILKSFNATDPEIINRQNQLFAKIAKALKDEADAFTKEVDEIAAKGDKDALNEILLKCERNVGAYPNSASAFFDLAFIQDNLKDFKHSLTNYSRAIEIAPNFVAAYYNRGVAKSDLGDKKGAIEDYTKVIEIAPNKLAVAYSNRGLAKSALGDKKGAIEDCNKAIDIDPNDVKAYGGRGMAKSDLGDNKGAIDDYNKAINIDPKFAPSYYSRGLARYALGDKKGAIEDYNKAINLDPKLAQPYSGRGLAKSALGDNKGAIEDYDRALECDPKYAKAYASIGLAKCALEDYKGAVEYCNKAIEIDPKDAPAYSGRGLAKCALEDYKEAIEDCNKALELDSKDAPAYYGRGIAKSALGDNKGAIEDWEKAISLEPQFKEKLQLYIDEAKVKLADAGKPPGEAKLGRGDFEGAKEDCDKAIEANPNDASAYENRGCAKSMLGDKKGALADYDKALELKPDYAEAYNNRGVLKYMLGDYEGALPDLEKACLLHPAYKSELQSYINGAKKKLESKK